METNVPVSLWNQIAYKGIINRSQPLSCNIDDTFPVYAPQGGIATSGMDSCQERFFVVGCCNGSILCHDLQKDGVVVGSSTRGKGHTHSVSSIHWLPRDAGLFVTGSMDKSLKIWNTATFSSVYTFNLRSHINNIALSPIPGGTTRKLIGVCRHNCNELTLCDMGSGSSIQTLIGHEKEVMCCDWSPVSEFVLASGSADRTIMFWDIRRSGKSAMLGKLDQENREKRLTSKSSYAHDGIVTFVRFVHGGNYIVSSGSDGRITSWKACSEKQYYRNTRVHYCSTIADPVRVSAHGVCAVTCEVPDKDVEIFHTLGASGAVFGSFDLLGGSLLEKHSGHFMKITSLTYRSLSQELLSTSFDGLIVRWTRKSNHVEEEIKQDDWDSDFEF